MLWYIIIILWLLIIVLTFKSGWKQCTPMTNKEKYIYVLTCPFSLPLYLLVLIFDKIWRK